jgi:hypothetical protein
LVSGGTDGGRWDAAPVRVGGSGEPESRDGSVVGGPGLPLAHGISCAVFTGPVGSRAKESNRQMMCNRICSGRHDSTSGYDTADEFGIVVLRHIDALAHLSRDHVGVGVLREPEL